ncbi:unnamed protein product [Gemmataceae bacterium]|nr:unnamed protein product [Gemmataceae bacterium]VTU00630.1 unnamed protein product [Gemmataceae bacterium]
MTRSHKALGLVLVVLVGAWGCAKAPAPSGGGNPALEAKAKRLDEDFRAAAAARDQFRLRALAAEEKVSAAESRAIALQAQLDEARASASTVRAERDQMAAQYESFRTNIKSLLGQAESSLNKPAGSLSPASPASPPPPSALSN